MAIANRWCQLKILNLFYWKYNYLLTFSNFLQINQNLFSLYEKIMFVGMMRSMRTKKVIKLDPYEKKMYTYTKCTTYWDLLACFWSTECFTWDNTREYVDFFYVLISLFLLNPSSLCSKVKNEPYTKQNTILITLV